MLNVESIPMRALIPSADFERTYRGSLRCSVAWFVLTAFLVPQECVVAGQPLEADRYNVLLIMSDDLTSTALSCYGSQLCRTPNIDALAARGTRYTRAYCQGTYCGPSRASMLSGYYPHATGVLGYRSPRPKIGDRPTWPELFKRNGYYTARVSKIYHMGVPGGVLLDDDGPQQDKYNGADDAQSWTERFNTPGPEWQAAGDGETLEGNPDGKKPVVGGNTFVVVEADGDDLVHADGKAAAKAVEVIRQHADQPFWLGVGFVRPHVPFVAPRKYFQPFLPYSGLPLPDKFPNDWDDIPKAGINYKTSRNMQMDERRQKKALGGYLASVAYMDAMVGQVMDAVRDNGLLDRTIVIFTSDHGYHLGEHDFWAKVSLRDESAGVPLIISVPGQEPAVCHSLVELLDLYPTTARLCGLTPPTEIQGLDISETLSDPQAEVRNEAFSVAPMRKGFLLRSDRWAYLQYGEQAENGVELFDTQNDPQQFHNLADRPEHKATVAQFQQKLTAKLQQVRDNDLAVLAE
ncbi:MAG: sulfatase [Fuerstiella sp.]